MKSYTATYEPDTINDERGWSWKLFAKRRLVAEGWTRGRKHEAETEVRIAIASRDTIRSFIGAA